MSSPTDPPPELAHHFADLEQQHEAGRLGMWVFLATEVLFFSGMFLAYAVYRSLHPQAFEEGSRTLDALVGAANTAVLITSSFTMALAVHAAHAGRSGLARALVLATAALGTAFLAVKGYEWNHHFQTGHVPGPDLDLFLSYYYAMTGFHGVHVLIGVAVLAVLGALGSRPIVVELTGLYWHLVDLVWIFLFPLFYLLGRHG